MSKEHAVEVVRLGPVEPHPNADALDMTKVFGGYPCIVKRDTFREGDLAVYVPIDTLVPVALPDFAFLAPRANGEGFARIRAMKLRGIFSMGLLIPAPEGVGEGADLAVALGTGVYEPPVSGDPDAFPDVSGLPAYTDIEGFRRYGSLFDPDEVVVVTEKLEGENARFAHLDGVGFWIGSRTKAKDPTGSTRWAAIARDMRLAEKLAQAPGVMVSGECYGYTGGFPYDGVGFRAFDALDVKSRKYLDFDDFVALMERLDIPMAPILYRGPFDGVREELAEGPTSLGGMHVREGFVIKPVRERWTEEVGRLVLKLKGQGYLLR